MTTLRNNVQLIGRLGKDPQAFSFDNGTKKVTFSIATTDVYYNNKGEKVEDTQWHNLVAWGKRADIAENYLKKGSEVAIQGKLITHSYEKDGDTKYITEISVNELLMVGGKK